jgi:Leucine-rich repeat (LRR) protein
MFSGGYVHLYRVLPLLADGQFPNLQHLVLRNSVRKRATPEINDACLLIISKVTALRSLHLTGFKKVTNIGAAMLTTLQSLEELSIVDCQNVHRGVAAALKALTNLRNLELSHNAFSRSRESPLFVVSKMTKLQSFKHFASAKITDDVLYQLRHLANLETLCITAAPYLTAGGVEKLMPYLGSGLRTLHIRWCPTIKSLSFLKFLVNVEELDLGGCYNLTDRDLKPIRKYCTKLQTLSIARLDKITENAITHVVLKLTTLESLSVSGCGCTSPAPPPNQIGRQSN